jgi:hypothetical protein
MSEGRRTRGRSAIRIRVLVAVLTAGILTSTTTVGRAVDSNLVRGVCFAKGPLQVIAGNQVRFSAQGRCGPFNVQISDSLGPFQFSYPIWTGGCNYGPPLPRLRLQVVMSYPDVAGFYRDTFWDFPRTVVGADRASTPNWLTRLYIREIVDDSTGRPTKAGPMVGQGALVVKIPDGCDFRRAGGAKVTVVFAVYGDLTNTDSVPI